MLSIKEFLFNKNSMLVFSYLLKNLNRENISSHIARELEISVGSVHAMLKQLQMVGIVKSRTLGKSVLYDVNTYSPRIKAFRIFDNLIDLELLISEIKDNSRKINLVYIDMLEFMSMEQEDAVFYDEVMKGIELWAVTDG